MHASLLVVAALAARILAPAAPADADVDVVGGVGVGPPPPHRSTTAVRFLDGDAERVALRLDADRDASWPSSAVAAVRYVDPPTGRAQTAYVDDTAVVRFAAGVDPAAAAAARGLVVVRPLYPRLSIHLVRDAAGADGLAIAARLVDDVRAGTTIRGAFPNLWLRRAPRAFDGAPDDPRYVGQNYFDTIEMEGAWARSTGDPDVVVAIVDDGCDMLHEDLSDKFVGGVDVLSNDDDPSYEPDVAGNEHGTACAGLAAATTDNRRGIAGACPDCSMLCVRFILAGGGLVPISSDLDVVREQMERGVDVSSNSWGYAEPTPVPADVRAAYEDFFDEGRDGKGAIIVFAAGNDDREISDDELEAVRGILSVGAVTNLEETAQFSNRGAALDLTCPLGTLTTDISGADGAGDDDYFSTFGGTSSSTPIVAGIAGLLIAAAPDATAQQIHDALTTTAKQSLFATPDERGHDVEYGWGIVQPVAALAALVGPAVEPVVIPPPTTCAAAPGSLPTLLALLFVTRRGRRSSAA